MMTYYAALDVGVRSLALSETIPNHRFLAREERCHVAWMRVWMKPQMSAAPHTERAPKRGSPARSDQCSCRSAPPARPTT
jgi:hypothetical protein